MKRKVAIFALAAAALAGAALFGSATFADLRDDDEDEQPLPAGAGDLASVTAIHVKDSTGQVVLEGTFGAPDQDGDETDRKATLAGAAAGARGEAEIELKGTGASASQELEVSVKGLAASATFTVAVDGREVATLTTDAKGKAEVELAGAVSR